MTTRRVRTPEGARKYDQPIGSVIVRDALPVVTRAPKVTPKRDPVLRMPKPKPEPESKPYTDLLLKVWPEFMRWLNQTHGSVTEEFLREHYERLRREYSTQWGDMGDGYGYTAAGDSWRWQLRDKNGNWIEMGAEVKWLWQGLEREGLVIGQSSPGVATVREHLTELIHQVPSNRLEVTKSAAEVVARIYESAQGTDKPDWEKLALVEFPALAEFAKRAREQAIPITKWSSTGNLLPDELAPSNPSLSLAEERTVRERLVDYGLSLDQAARYVQAYRRNASEILAQGYRFKSGVFDEYKIDQAKELRKDSNVVIAITPFAADQMLGEGRYQTQFETGNSGGLIDPDRRSTEELQRLGLLEDIPVEQRPVYGFLAKPGSEDTQTVDQYGTVRIVLKPEVRDRTTMVIGDSLAGEAQPIPVTGDVTDEQLRSALSIAPGDYVEAQIHNGVTVDDIEKIIITPQADTAFEVGDVKYLLETAERVGVPVEDRRKSQKSSAKERPLFDPTPALTPEREALYRDEAKRALGEAVADKALGGTGSLQVYRVLAEDDSLDQLYPDALVYLSRSFAQDAALEHPGNKVVTSSVPVDKLGPGRKDFEDFTRRYNDFVYLQLRPLVKDARISMVRGDVAKAALAAGGPHESWRWQLRDADGQWIDMGAAVKWLVKGRYRHGTVVGSRAPGMAIVADRDSGDRYDLPSDRLTLDDLAPRKVPARKKAASPRPAKAVTETKPAPSADFWGRTLTDQPHEVRVEDLKPGDVVTDLSGTGENPMLLGDITTGGPGGRYMWANGVYLSGPFAGMHASVQMTPSSKAVVHPEIAVPTYEESVKNLQTALAEFRQRYPNGLATALDAALKPSPLPEPQMSDELKEGLRQPEYVRWMAERDRLSAKVADLDWGTDELDQLRAEIDALDTDKQSESIQRTERLLAEHRAAYQRWQDRVGLTAQADPRSDAALAILADVQNIGAQARLAMNIKIVRETTVEDGRISNKVRQLRRDTARDLIDRLVGTAFPEQVQQAWKSGKDDAPGLSQRLRPLKPAEKKALTEALLHYPKSWVLNFNGVTQPTTYFGTRGYNRKGEHITISDPDPKIGLNGDGSPERAVMTHEIGHSMERVVPGLQDLEQVFWHSRVEDGDLTMVPDDGGYYVTDQQVRRRTAYRYTMKAYGNTYRRGNNWEVFTTGVQNVLGDGDIDYTSNNGDDSLWDTTMGALLTLDTTPVKAPDPAAQTTTTVPTGAPMDEAAGIAKVQQVTRQFGGASIKVTGEEPIAGYMAAQLANGIVVPADEFFGEAGVEQLKAFMRDNAAAFKADPSLYLGLWHDKEHGVVTVDISHNIMDEQEAKEFGKAQNQVSVWDVVNKKEIDTGGTGGYVTAAVSPAGIREAARQP